MATHVRTDRRARRSARRAHASGEQSSTVAQTSGRLLEECLDELMEQLARTDGPLPAVTIARLARLVSAVSALRDLHAVDEFGHCLQCQRSGFLRRRRPCSVHEVLDEFLGCEPGLFAQRIPADARALSDG